MQREDLQILALGYRGSGQFFPKCFILLPGTHEGLVRRYETASIELDSPLLDQSTDLT